MTNLAFKATAVLCIVLGLCFLRKFTVPRLSMPALVMLNPFTFPHLSILSIC